MIRLKIIFLQLKFSIIRKFSISILLWFFISIDLFDKLVLQISFIFLSLTWITFIISMSFWIFWHLHFTCIIHFIWSISIIKFCSSCRLNSIFESILITKYRYTLKMIIVILIIHRYYFLIRNFACLLILLQIFFYLLTYKFFLVCSFQFKFFLLIIFCIVKLRCPKIILTFDSFLSLLNLVVRNDNIFRMC